MVEDEEDSVVDAGVRSTTRSGTAILNTASMVPMASDTAAGLGTLRPNLTGRSI